MLSHWVVIDNGKIKNYQAVVPSTWNAGPRDDQGRPKQAMIGGVPRLRMSSQSVKRALRESSFFALDLQGHIGTRTKQLQDRLREHLLRKGASDKVAADAATLVDRGRAGSGRG